MMETDGEIKDCKEREEEWGGKKGEIKMLHEM